MESNKNSSKQPRQLHKHPLKPHTQLLPGNSIEFLSYDKHHKQGFLPRDRLMGTPSLGTYRNGTYRNGIVEQRQRKTCKKQTNLLPMGQPHMKITDICIVPTEMSKIKVNKDQKPQLPRWKSSQGSVTKSTRTEDIMAAMCETKADELIKRLTSRHNAGKKLYGPYSKMRLSHLSSRINEFIRENRSRISMNPDLGTIDERGTGCEWPSAPPSTPDVPPTPTTQTHDNSLLAEADSETPRMPQHSRLGALDASTDPMSETAGSGDPSSTGDFYQMLDRLLDDEEKLALSNAIFKDSTAGEPPVAPESESLPPDPAPERVPDADPEADPDPAPAPSLAVPGSFYEPGDTKIHTRAIIKVPTTSSIPSKQILLPEHLAQPKDAACKKKPLGRRLRCGIASKKLAQGKVGANNKRQVLQLNPRRDSPQREPVGTHWVTLPHAQLEDIQGSSEANIFMVISSFKCNRPTRESEPMEDTRMQVKNTASDSSLAQSSQKTQSLHDVPLKKVKSAGLTNCNRVFQLPVLGGQLHPHSRNNPDVQLRRPLGRSQAQIPHSHPPKKSRFTPQTTVITYSTGERVHLKSRQSYMPRQSYVPKTVMLPVI